MAFTFLSGLSLALALSQANFVKEIKDSPSGSVAISYYPNDSASLVVVSGNIENGSVIKIQVDSAADQKFVTFQNGTASQFYKKDMATLFDKIKYDGKRYADLQDQTGIQEIERLAAKLKPLETEIISDPKGTITIMKSGNVFSDSFERGLAAKITDIITGRG